jgi:hypothetical protein
MKNTLPERTCYPEYYKTVYFGPYSLFINEIEKVDIIKNLQLTKISAKKQAALDNLFK